MASILYVARDIERALGKEPAGDYSIVTNTTPFALEIQKKYLDNVWLINMPKILDTYELLSTPEVQEMISKKKAKILVFKNTIHIEQLCKENRWELLNPSGELSEKIENKITQVAWLGELEELLSPHTILALKDVRWNKKPLILQWAHSHTGEGTILIQKEKDLDILKEKFPYREVRVADFIKGPMFTINIVVTESAILLGNISYQITGMPPFTENLFSTIGNDWSLPYSILSEYQLSQFNSIAEKIAEKMRTSGWRGLFGIDVIYDEERDQLYLIEINPRQPASTTYESELQKKNSIKGITIFEAHLNALLDIPISSSIIPLNDGAQIIQRVCTNNIGIDQKRLNDAGYKTIKYSNIKLNSDLLRIQSPCGIMKAHNKFNKRGKEILEFLK